MECPEEKSKVQAERVERLKAEWKNLWKDRFDDSVRAEAIANGSYSSLSVEKGTVIFANRDFKLLSLKEILEEHGIGDVYKFVSPSPGVGGWGKFIKGSVLQGRPRSRAGRVPVKEEKKPRQLRKSGRGWLHV